MEQDSSKACQDYSNTIHGLGGIDLQLLGLGHNGHIGFNEPDVAFEKDVHCVNFSKSTIQANSRFFSCIDDVPNQAYTMGIKTIIAESSI